MRRKLLIFLPAIIFLLRVPVYCAPVPDVAQQADEIVSIYRKVIVLTSDDAVLDALARDRISILGRMLFQQNEDRLSALHATLAGDRSRLGQFLDHLERHPDYPRRRQAVFRDLLDDLIAYALN